MTRANKAACIGSMVKGSVTAKLTKHLARDRPSHVHYALVDHSIFWCKKATKKQLGFISLLSNNGSERLRWMTDVAYKFIRGEVRVERIWTKGLSTPELVISHPKSTPYLDRFITGPSQSSHMTYVTLSINI